KPLGTLGFLAVVGLAGAPALADKPAVAVVKEAKAGDAKGATETGEAASPVNTGDAARSAGGAKEESLDSLIEKVAEDEKLAELEAQRAKAVEEAKAKAKAAEEQKAREEAARKAAQKRDTPPVPAALPTTGTDDNDGTDLVAGPTPLKAV